MKRAYISVLLGTVGLAALSSPALAQDAGNADQAAEAEAAPEDGDVIVVVGTAGGAGIRKQDASFAITTMDTEAISQAGLKSTAEAFALVPGVWAESSGGKSGANIDVRGLPGGGDAPFVSMSINGAAIFGVPTLNFFEQSTAFRVDETIAGVEALRGGPSAVFGRGEPGVTMNFRLKEGGDTTEGTGKFTFSDYGLYQVDAVVSGPLGGDFSYMVGGYWSTSPGIRDAGFQSEKGLQGTAQLTWKGSAGKVNLFTRWTDDVGQWYLPMALTSGNDQGTFSQLGPRTRYRTLQVDQTGRTRTFDFANGRGWRGSLSGINAEFDISDSVTIRNNMAYLDGNADTYGFVPDGQAIQVRDLVAGTAQTRDGVVLGAGEFVQNYGHWVVTKDLKSFSNDLSLTWKTDRNELTVGYYRSDFSSKDFWTLGNFTPVHNVAQGDFLSAATTCQDLQAGGSGSGCWAYGINSSGNTTINAVYAGDSYEVTDALRIDGGIRKEWMSIDTFIDEGPGYPNGTIDRSFDTKYDAMSWTLAANYAFSDSFGAFIRASDGFVLPMFDDLRNNQVNIKDIKQYEAGLKYSGDWMRMYATVFKNDYEASTGGVGSVLPPTEFTTKAKGFELDGALIFGGFNLGINATFQDSKVSDSANPILIGNRIPRQPKWQFRLAPSYKLEIGDWSASLYGSLAYAGFRWGDFQNTQELPSYTKVDLGTKVEAPNGMFFQVALDNLFDSHGLTESDGRTIGNSNGRPILGRSARFSVGFNF